MIPRCRKNPGIEFRRSVPAHVESIEAMALEIRRTLEVCCSARDAFAAELLFREALANAVLHGCRLDPDRRILVIVRVFCGRVVFVVEDDGPGFDWRAHRNRPADNTAACGRGLEIYRTYADRIRFNRKGNGLILVRSLRGNIA